MHTLERYALSDEPQPVSRADEINGEDTGYSSLLGLLNLSHQVVVITVSNVTPIEPPETTLAPLSLATVYELPTGDDEIGFLDYTPPLIADRRFYMKVREGKLPEPDWEL